jgi:hypothetical protein
VHEILMWILSFIRFCQWTTHYPIIVMICLENGVYYIECKVFIIDDLELCDQQMTNWLCISILVFFFFTYNHMCFLLFVHVSMVLVCSWKLKVLGLLYYNALMSLWMCGLVNEMCCFLGEFFFFFPNDLPKKCKMKFIRNLFVL